LLEKKIQEFAINNNIIIGICNAERLTHIENYLKNENTPFVPKEIEKRINPKLIMDDANSIIVIGVNYNKKIVAKNDEKLRGKFSIDAIGQDYHITVKNILRDLVNKLGMELLDKNDFSSKSNLKAKIFSDNGDLIERELALKSGLGVLGRNTNIISKKFGSYFNIGYIVTNAKLETSEGNEPFKIGCYDCKKCVTVCPGKALSNEMAKCDFNKCISYSTQKKGVLSNEEMKNMGTHIYGCDICQLVCPHNTNIESEIIYDIDIVNPELERLLTLTKSEFILKYKKTSSGWRGKKLFKRNAIIALHNIGGKEAIATIEKYIDDNDNDIKNLYMQLNILRHV
jgi:epoxyqueuosine reductase